MFFVPSAAIANWNGVGIPPDNGRYELRTDDWYHCMLCNSCATHGHVNAQPHLKRLSYEHPQTRALPHAPLEAKPKPQPPGPPAFEPPADLRGPPPTMPTMRQQFDELKGMIREMSMKVETTQAKLDALNTWAMEWGAKSWSHAPTQWVATPEDGSWWSASVAASDSASQSTAKDEQWHAGAAVQSSAAAAAVASPPASRWDSIAKQTLYSATATTAEPQAGDDANSWAVAKASSGDRPDCQ